MIWSIEEQQFYEVNENIKYLVVIDSAWNARFMNLFFKSESPCM